MKAILNKIDNILLGSNLKKFWSLYDRYRYEQGLEKSEKERFEKDRMARNEKYSDSKLVYANNSEIIKYVKEIEANGYIVIKNFATSNALRKAKDFVDNSIKTGTHLKGVIKDSARAAIDLEGPNIYFSPEECLKGGPYFRENTNYVAVEDPLCNISELSELAFHPTILSIVHHYLKGVPALGGMNLRKSFVNDLNEYDTLYFHVDKNSPKFLKAFFYLNDVDKNGGPFCFVKHSHKKKFPLWMKKYRWTNDEIVEKYGNKNIINITANVGDLIIADTTGFHRGTKVKSNDRYMLTLDYVIHPEFKGKSEVIQINKNQFNSFTNEQKAACDFLTII